MLTNQTILKEILAKILNIDTSEFDVNTRLLGALPELDSMSIMMLLVELEQYFLIRIDPADISANHFESMTSLELFVEQQKSS